MLEGSKFLVRQSSHSPYIALLPESKLSSFESSTKQRAVLTCVGARLCQNGDVAGQSAATANPLGKALLEEGQSRYLRIVLKPEYLRQSPDCLFFC